MEGDGANTTTALVKKLQNGNETLEYTYDEVGNITSVSKNGTVVESYTYDSLGQLTKVIRGTDTFDYAYDNGGNILSVTKNGVTVNSYTYGNSTWKDLLTGYNGVTITYDEIGNPLNWHNGMTFQWEYGRRLTSITKGNDNISYTYNADGLRTSKTVNGVTTEYEWLDGTLLGQRKGSEHIVFLYDENGTAYGMTVNSGTSIEYYYYIFNLQGDVIGILNQSGQKVVEYTYGAWGNILSITGSMANSVGKSNPIRYRGYYYDNETGFYYLNSRYYDPEIGRWINADAAIGQIGNVQGSNMFAYCFNNPVNMSDPTGNWPKLSTIFTVVAVAAVAVTAVAVTVATCGAAAPALAAAGGGVIGGISAGAAATAASVATGAMIVAGVSTVAAVTSAVAEKAVEKTAKRNNSVYVLKDDAGTVQYVGRTNNVDKRRAAHSANPARAGLEMEVIASGLNLPESRALEQAGIAYYHTINTANKMNNQINSVSPKYWGAFKELALGTLNYGWNQMSNEILYWTGN